MKFPRAFCNWVKHHSNNDAFEAALYLRGILATNPANDNVVWAVLESTGDKEYTMETFIKAAKLVLENAA